MLCPSCRKLISISAPQCPFCGVKNPGLYGYGPALAGTLSRLDPVSLIPKVCLVLYVVALVLDLRSALRPQGGFLQILSPGLAALRLLGATSSVDLALGRPWTLLTAIYLHGGILHILFNMLWIRSLGPETQRCYGPARFFVIWTLAGAVGFFLSNLRAGSVSLGASGSIFGLFAALIVYGRSVGEMHITRQLWQWAIILGVMGFLIPGVDNLAHIGGFAGGWVTATVLRPRGGGGRGVLLLALALLALTLLGFAANFVGLIRILASAGAG
jgi:rhomboid protease GluP